MTFSTFLSPIIIFIAFAVYGVVHSWTASLGLKDFSRKLFGEVSERLYRIAYNIFSFITLMPILALPVLLPDMPLYRVGAPWRYLMFAGQLLGVVIAVVSVLETGAMEFAGLSQLLGIKTDSALTTRGLHRYVRHPIYTGSILFLVLSPEMSLNQAALYLAFILYFVVGAVFEERKLVQHFGQAYIDYRERTPMLLPLRWGKK